MGKEIYFSIRNGSSEKMAKALNKLSYVDRFYTASKSEASGTYIIGTSHQDARSVLASPLPYSECFKLPVKSVLFDYKKEPGYISVIHMRKPVAEDRMRKIFDRLDFEESGISYRRSSGLTSTKLASNLVRVALSEEGPYEISEYKSYRQALILELDSMRSGSKLISKILGEDIERTFDQKTNLQGFSILGSDLRQTIKTPPPK